MKLFGHVSLEKKLKTLPQKTQKAIFRTNERSAIKVLGTAQKSIQQGKKTGEVYLRGKNRDIKHRASAPGEAPATDTGNLVSKLKYMVHPDELKITIGIHGENWQDVPYARRLEWGGSDSRGIYIAPRPYLQPAFEANKDFIKKQSAIAVKKVNQAFAKQNKRRKR